MKLLAQIILLLWIFLSFGCGGGTESEHTAVSALGACDIHHEHDGLFSAVPTGYRLSFQLESPRDSIRRANDTGSEPGVDIVRYAVESGETLRFVHELSPAVMISLRGPDGKTVGSARREGDEFIARDLKGGEYTLELSNTGAERTVFLNPESCMQASALRHRSAAALGRATTGTFINTISISQSPGAFMAHSQYTLIGTIPAGSSSLFGKPVSITSPDDLINLLGPQAQGTRLSRAVAAFQNANAGSLTVIAVAGDEMAPSVVDLSNAFAAYSASPTASYAVVSFVDIPALGSDDVVQLYQSSTHSAAAAINNLLMVVGGFPADIQSAPQAAAFASSLLPASSRLALYYPQNQASATGDSPFDVGVLVAATLSRGDVGSGPWHASIGAEAEVIGFSGTPSGPTDTTVLSAANVNQLVATATGVGLLGENLRGAGNGVTTIHEQRTAGMIATSVALILRAYVFAPNDAMTWNTLVNTVSDLLTQVYQLGGLAGSGGSDTFAVSCGVGTTMTDTDVLNGYLILAMTFAMTEPGKFLETTVTQIMGTG